MTMESMTLWIIALTILLVLNIGLSALGVYKLRKVHLATYPILEDLAATKKETHSLFRQLQALNALEKKLNLKHELPPLRGWAGSPDFLLVVANQVLNNKPKIVMECSSGASTLVIARCLQLNGSGHVYSLEHDSSYAEKTRSLISQNALSEWATVLHAPLETKNTETPWYAKEAIPKHLKQIDMLVVDGPPSMIAPLSRLPALPSLLDRLAKKAIIIMDDADRPDEKEIVNRWISATAALELKFIECEKGCAILSLMDISKSPNPNAIGNIDMS